MLKKRACKKTGKREVRYALPGGVEYRINQSSTKSARNILLYLKSRDPDNWVFH